MEFSFEGLVLCLLHFIAPSSAAASAGRGRDLFRRENEKVSRLRERAKRARRRLVDLDSPFSKPKQIDSHPLSTRSLHSVTSFSRACSSPELSSSERAAAWAVEEAEEASNATEPASSTILFFALFGAPEARGSIAAGGFRCSGGFPYRARVLEGVA